MDNQVKEISVTKAFEEIKNGIIFLDVRESEELAEMSFDVPNIMSIPLGELEERMDEIPKDRDVLLVCRGGWRSLKATEILLKNGFTKVANMKGGILEWVENNLPVIKGIINE